MMRAAGTLSFADPDAELRAYVRRLLSGEGIAPEQDYITEEIGTLPRQFSEDAQAVAAHIARQGGAGSGFMQQAADTNRRNLALARGEATMRGQRRYQDDRMSREDRAMAMQTELADREMRRAAIAEERRRNTQAEYDAVSPIEHAIQGRTRPE
jgi:hypothetical protein